MTMLRSSGEDLALLSPQETDVLLLLIQGHLNKEIAFRLHLRESAVKKRIGGMLQNLGLPNRTALAVFALSRPEILRREAVSIRPARLTLASGPLLAL